MQEQAGEARAKHILVVDDNVELAQTYKELFQVHGYTVSIATNGVLALKLLLDIDVDAILCDLTMPQLEGDMFYGAVERIRPELVKRFAFVTGNADNPKYAEFLKSNACPVLRKPVSVDGLLETLRGLLEPACRK
jgi:CheY-like chemotaxis protein